jgi:cell fate regulator YaaT (PSP1 superfamily)
MSAVPEVFVRPDAADQFVVSFGKGGAVGVFNAPAPLLLRRGDRVIVHTPRGTEVGSVLCAATIRQARLLGATASGSLLRPLSAEDEQRLPELAQLAQQVYDAGRCRVQQDQLALEILDVEVLFDRNQAILQFVGEAADLDEFAHALERDFDLEVRLENLAQPGAADTHEHGGCDKPDCGRNAGGCTTCSTGGGCTSCGSSKVDMRQYFAHLRDKMEKDQRRPLL